VGTPIDPDSFAKQFVRLCKTAALGHWHPHEARHSAAGVMLAQGVPPPSGWRRHSAGRGAILAF
jgi:integrase